MTCDVSRDDRLPRHHPSNLAPQVFDPERGLRCRERFACVEFLSGLPGKSLQAGALRRRHGPGVVLVRILRRSCFHKYSLLPSEGTP